YFVEVLLANRPDLKGLPFVTGAACRLEKSDARRFNDAVQLVRSFRPQSTNPLAATAPVEDAKTFWRGLAAGYQQQDQSYSASFRGSATIVVPRIAALTQMLAADTGEFHIGLADYLGKCELPESTKALARLAIYSGDEKVRRVAIDGLRNRDQKEYTDVLLGGLRYPWPAVAHHAADAVAELGRTDLVPDLVKLLGDPDPRAPFVKDVDGK